MIEIRFTGDTQLDGILYKKESVICIDDARANMCIDACWAVDNVTGRAGTLSDDPVRIEIDNIEVGMSCS